MDIPQISNPMAGPVIIIQPLPPKRLSCRIIQGQSRAAMQEPGIRQMQHTADYRSKMPPHFPGDLSQRYRSGNIRGAFPVVSAGIRQEKSLGLQFHIRFRRGGIMGACRMLLIRADRPEAGSHIMLLHPPKFLQLCGSRHLRDAFLPDIRFQPVHELRVRNPVLDVGISDILRFHRILDCLHQHDWIFRLDLLDLPGNIAEQGIIHLLRIQHHLLFLSECFHTAVNPVIRIQGHMIFPEIRFHFIGKLPLIRIQLDPVLPDYRIGKKQRKILHIISADIQEPSDIVQAGDHQHVCLLFFHGLPHPRQLMLHRFPGISDVQEKGRFFRKRRAFLPDLIHQIQIIPDTAALV